MMSYFSVFFTFLLFISSSSSNLRPNRYFVSNDTILSSKYFNEAINNQQLLSDDQPLSIGSQNGKDVDITQTGEIDVILEEDKLVFQFCTTGCDGEVSVSFEGTPVSSSPATNSNQCSFIAGADNSKIWFMNPNKHISDLRKNIDGCGSAKIEDIMEFKMPKHSLEAPGCVHKDVDKTVKLLVKSASSSCVLTVKNVKIKPPTVPTTTTTKDPSISLASSTASTENAEFPLYGWILIGIGSLIILVVVCVFAFCFILKFNSKKQTSDDKKRAAAMEEKKVENEIPELPEKKSQKKLHKSVTNENKEQREEPKTPTVKVDSKAKQGQEVAPKKDVKQLSKEKQAPKPSAEKIPSIVVETPKKKVPENPKVPYPMDDRSARNKEKSLKSGTQSVSDKMDVNRIALVESHVKSLSRHGCLEKMSFAQVQDMKDDYDCYGALKGRILDESEITIFHCSISQMFAELNRMSAKAEKSLMEYGVKFDEKKQITKMTDDARVYIRDHSTPEYVVYFAFGAEYSEHITSDLKMIHKFSIPLLMVVALMIRFPEFNRRKACTLIRRQVPTIQEVYPIYERASMTFPIDILEIVHNKNPEAFKNIDTLDTDSNSNGEKHQPSNQVKDQSKPNEDVTQESKTMKKNKKVIIVKSQTTQSESRKKSKKQSKKNKK